VKEFKEFLSRGNVLDMSVGVIIGTAFGNIVTSLVNDVLMPPIGLLLGKVNFSHLYINLSGRRYANWEAADEAGAAMINYGAFLNTLVDFLIIAFAIFIVIKQINKIRSIAAAKKNSLKPKQSERITCPYCKSRIPVDAIKCRHCTSHVKYNALSRKTG
jgi:large conductance mechanosensitive channel